MESLIISLICIVAFGVPAFIIARKYDEAREKAYKMQQRYAAEIQRLENEIAIGNIRKIFVETESQRLFQEQMNLKLDAMDACKAMLRETMRS